RRMVQYEGRFCDHQLFQDLLERTLALRSMLDDEIHSAPMPQVDLLTELRDLRIAHDVPPQHLRVVRHGEPDLAVQRWPTSFFYSLDNLTDHLVPYGQVRVVRGHVAIRGQKEPEHVPTRSMVADRVVVPHQLIGMLAAVNL